MHFTNLLTFSKRFMAMSLIGVSLLTVTPTVYAAESNDTAFIPFRSYYLSYLATHSGENSAENIYLWCKMLSEQINGTNNSSAGDWFSTYNSEIVLPGGDYISESDAKNEYLYKNGVSNSIYDTMIANIITNNGFEFLDAWINGYTDKNGLTILSASDGKESFINFFDNEYETFPKTAAAIVALTQTEEGKVWLQNYSYEKNGSNEKSIGINLLKLMCVDFNELNENQLNWCKNYLPYLLSNYVSNGSNALAASTKNAYLYDFMARSINGAQYTGTKATATIVNANGVNLGTVAAGTTLQQEFFNYVVASQQGFGAFIQNIIGGQQYTGAYSNTKDLSSFETASSILMAPDADIDYYTASANGGDNDTDWFDHAMYLQSTNGSYPTFATIYKLVMNNASTKAYYQDWISRFHGKSGKTEAWNYIQEQKGTTGPIIQFDWVTYGAHKNGPNCTGLLAEGNPGQAIGRSDSNNFVYTHNWGERRSALALYGWYTGTVKGITFNGEPHWINNGSGTWGWTQPLNKDYSNFDSVTVGLLGWDNWLINFDDNTFKETGGFSMPWTDQLDTSATVQIRAGSTSGTIVGSAVCTVKDRVHANVTIDIPEKYKSQNLYLVITMSNEQLRNLGKHPGAEGGGYLESVTLSWKGSTQKCIDGHSYKDFTYSYSEDYKTVIVSHECTVCGVDETEKITATVTETDTSYIYTYTPTVLSNELSSWTKIISKDLGSGTVTINAASGADKISGNWTVSNNKYSIGIAHEYKNATTYRAVTSSSAIAEGIANVKTGAIKANAKQITVIGEHSTSPREYLVVSVYDKNNKLIKTESGYYSITINLEDLSLLEKEGCWISINHSRSLYAYTYGPWNDLWDNYPAPVPITSVSGVNSVKITY